MNRLLGLLCAALLAFTPTFAAASVTTTGAGKVPSGGGGGGYTGPGDIVSGAKAFYSLRAYNAAQATAQAAAVRLKRSSDNEKCDLKLTTAGGLSTVTSNCSGASAGATATTWCANGAGSCTVDTWYDQTGNGNSQTSGGAPPFVFSCLGSLPCVQFTGANYLNGGASSTSQPLSVSAVAYHNSAATGQNDIIAGANGIFFNSGGGHVGGYFGAAPSVVASDNAFHALQFVVNTSSSVISVDGTESASQNFGANALDASFFMGAQSSTPTSPLTGYIAEVGLWSSAITTGGGGQASQLCHNQYAYWGTSTSC